MKKLYSLITICLIAFLLVGCGITSSSITKDSAPIQKAEVKKLTIDNFIDALSQNGLTVTNRRTTEAGMIGARETYIIDVNNKPIDIGWFDLNSKDEAAIKHIKEMQQTGILTVVISGTELKTKVEMNKDAVLSLHDHPEKEKIIEVFESFK